MAVILFAACRSVNGVSDFLPTSAARSLDYSSSPTQFPMTHTPSESHEKNLRDASVQAEPEVKLRTFPEAVSREAFGIL